MIKNKIVMNINRIKIRIATILPITASLSRFFRALINHISKKKKSYSQHREDEFIFSMLRNKFPNINYNYVDIGAFHPSNISNTYLLYKNKFYGITFEPNEELYKLHKIFRSKDIQIQAAVNDRSGINKFYFQKVFPSLSSLTFNDTINNVEIKYIPTLTLDNIYKSLNLKQIFFLSIDVEGNDYSVLQGGKETIKNFYLICIESNLAYEDDKLTNFLSSFGFVLIKKLGCNLIYENIEFKLL